MNYFTFNGINSLSMDIVVSEKSSYNSPQRDVTKQKIPGRNGDLIIDNGSFNNIEISYTCSIVCKRVEFLKKIDAVKEWLCADAGNYLILSDSYSPDCFRYAAYVNPIVITEAFGVGDFTISFDCKPLRHLFSGLTPVKLTSSGTLTNPSKISSLPQIKITGNGNISLTISGVSYVLKNVSEYIVLDSELESAFKASLGEGGSELQNNKMYSYPFPMLKPGQNSVSWSGSVTSVEIIPRWCCL